MLAIDSYKGHTVYQSREPNIYRVLDGKETYSIILESTGQEVFRFTAYYNQRLLLTIEDKEAKLFEILRPAREEIRRKIDAGDVTEGYLHVGTRLREKSVSA